MTYLIRILGFANGAPCPIAGQFLREFNFEAGNGIGHGVFTATPTRAKQFASAAEAFAFWRRQPVLRPLRPDGQPNRPLTASTIEVVTLDDAIAGEADAVAKMFQNARGGRS